MNKTVFILILLFVLFASSVNVYLVIHNSDWSDRTYALWNFSTAILFSVWVVKDVEKGGSKYIDLGYLFIVAWPIVLPFYLVRLRGFGRGMMMFFGLLLLSVLPWVSGLAAYFCFT